MIIRKPYAFLIKNFKKIHIALLLMSVFVLYKLVGVSSFVNDYMKTGVYEAYSNPITSHITWSLSLLTFLIFLGSGALIFLLRYKKKPWKVYLVPFIEYLVLFFVLNMIKSFFVGYTYDVETTDLRMSRDLLFVLQFAQLPAIGIFVMRVFGLDVQKFSFNTDKEFFELSEKDREEIEISLSVDHNTFIRLFKRIYRNIGYVYEEHKLICRVIIGIICFSLLFSGLKFIFVTNRSYHQGSNYNVDGFTFKINNSYFTDKDYKGDIISNKSNFVVLDMVITNNSAPQKINFEKFHLKNSSYDYVTTKRVYESEFKDLGTAYDSVKELRRGESVNLIVIYKVANKLNKNRFVLYYQERDGKLRKIKLKINDVSKIEDVGSYKMGDTFKFNYKNVEQQISFDGFKIRKTFDYTYRICNTTKCYVSQDTYTAAEDNAVLKIDFASNEFEGKDMIDFSSDYGKIVYIDSENIEHEINIQNPFGHSVTGKSMYTLIPIDAIQSSKFDIVYIIRNKKYTYSLR